MNVYLISLRYQDDDRVEDNYVAYTNEEDEDEVADMILCLPDFPVLETECIERWREEEEDDDEMFATPHAENVTDDYENFFKFSSWFNSLPILIDERPI